MGFFKDLSEDVQKGSFVSGKNGATASDELVNVTAPEQEALVNESAEESIEAEAVDESLIENLFGDTQTTEEEVIEEDYDIEEHEEPDTAKETSNDPEQVTVITRGTTINGSIVSDCSLNVMGTINGDIECLGKLSISGTVVGNSVASDVYVNAKRLEGNIDCEGTVKIGLGTVVVGDVKAGVGVVAGAVKGELDIRGPIVIDSTAIIKGNVKAKSIQMNNGAVLEGFCSLAYSSVDIDDIFE